MGTAQTNGQSPCSAQGPWSTPLGILFSVPGTGSTPAARSRSALRFTMPNPTRPAQVPVPAASPAPQPSCTSACLPPAGRCSAPSWEELLGQR